MGSNPTLCANATGHPETGCPVALACKMGGIRRAGKQTPRCGVCPPRGAAERGSGGFGGQARGLGKYVRPGLTFAHMGVK